jgi:homospermidine synthase
MTDEIISGADILGALVMGHPYQSWWCGSDLDIEESRRLVPHKNATTMQVAISRRRRLHVDAREPTSGVVRARRSTP